MPQFTFTSPEGKSYTVTGPAGATEQQAFGILQGQLKSAPAPKSTSLVDQIPNEFAGTQGVPSTAHAVSRPTETGNRDVLGILQGANVPLWGALQTLPIPPLQRFAAKELRQIRQTAPPVARAIGEGIGYVLPAEDVMKGAAVAERALPWAERALTAAGKGAAYGIGMTGSESPRDIAAKKLTSGALGAVAAPVAEAIPEVPSLFRKMKYVSGKEAAKAAESLRGEIGQTLDKPGEALPAYQAKGEKIIGKAAKQAAQDVQQQAAAKAGIAGEHPSDIGAKLGAEVDARQKMLAEVRRQQAESDKNAALREASHLEAQGKHASSHADMQNVISDIQNRLARQGGRETPLGNFYRDLLNKLEDRPTGQFEDRVVQGTGAMGEPVEQVKRSEIMQPATLAELDPVRRGLLNKMNPQAEGYDSLVANEARDIYGKLREALGKSFPKYGQYLSRYQEESAGLDPFKTRIGRMMTKEQLPWSEDGAKVTDPQNIPANAFRSPESFKQTAELLGDQKKASRYALNYFAHQVQGKNSAAVDTFIRSNRGVIESSGNLSKMEDYAARLKKLETWQKDRSTLAQNVAKAIDKRDAFARDYENLRNELDLSVKSEDVARKANQLSVRMMRDGIIDRPQFAKIQDQIASVRKAYENTEQSKQARRRLLNMMGLGMAGYMVHRYLWDKITGAF